MSTTTLILSQRFPRTSHLSDWVSEQVFARRRGLSIDQVRVLCTLGQLHFKWQRIYPEVPKQLLFIDDAAIDLTDALKLAPPPRGQVLHSDEPDDHDMTYDGIFA